MDRLTDHPNMIIASDSARPAQMRATTKMYYGDWTDVIWESSLKNTTLSSVVIIKTYELSCNCEWQSEIVRKAKTSLKITV